MKIPEFTAYELNEISRRARDPRLSERSRDYYSKCLEFVKDTVLNEMFDIEALTEPQIKWLWGIKKDLKDE